MPVKSVATQKRKFLELQRKVDKKLDELHAKVPSIIGKKIKPFEVRYDIHGVTCGGMAYSNVATGEHFIRLHPTALMEYGDKYIEDTLVHEFAHIVVMHHSWTAKPHGAEWKMVMRQLGVEPTRCCDWDLRKCLDNHGAMFGKTAPQVRKQKTFTYTCSCGHEHPITVRTHNKIRLGSVYVCKLCSGNLVLKG